MSAEKRMWQMCEHGDTEAHEWIKYIPMHGPMKMCCRGPAIATKPETPASDQTPDLRERIEALPRYSATVVNAGPISAARMECDRSGEYVKLDDLLFKVLDALKGERK